MQPAKRGSSWNDLLKVLEGASGVVAPNLIAEINALCHQYSATSQMDIPAINAIANALISSYDVSLTSYDLSHLAGIMQSLRDKENDARNISAAISNFANSPSEAYEIFRDLIQFAKHVGLSAGTDGIDEMILFHENIGDILLNASNGIKMLKDSGGADSLKSVLSVYSLFSRDKEKTQELISALKNPFLIGSSPYASLLMISDPSINNAQPFISNLFILSVLGEEETAMKIIELTQNMLGPALSESMLRLMRIINQHDLVKSTVQAGIEDIQIEPILLEITFVGQWFSRFYPKAKEEIKERMYEMLFHLANRWAALHSSEATVEILTHSSGQSDVKSNNMRNRKRIVISQNWRDKVKNMFGAVSEELAPLLGLLVQAIEETPQTFETATDAAHVLAQSINNHTAEWLQPSESFKYVNSILDTKMWHRILKSAFEKDQRYIDAINDFIENENFENIKPILIEIASNFAQEAAGKFSSGSDYRDPEAQGRMSAAVAKFIEGFYGEWFNKLIAVERNLEEGRLTIDQYLNSFASDRLSELQGTMPESHEFLSEPSKSMTERIASSAMVEVSTIVEGICSKNINFGAAIESHFNPQSDKDREQITQAVRQAVTNRLMGIIFKSLELLMLSDRLETEKILRKVQIEIEYFKESKESVVQVFRDFLPAPLMIRLFYGYMEKNQKLERLKREIVDNGEKRRGEIGAMYFEDLADCPDALLAGFVVSLNNFDNEWNRYLRDVFNKINEMISRNKGLAYKELLALRVGRGARNG
jgi:hypothetical protein